ncbi:cell division protein ZipA [Agaribacter flavus]|uniref:Cell division protein ZipA n=1 Tax=Agaribacter flavus TaxID=1902781 RepID=A0ABV7FJ09_9ALTE
MQQELQITLFIIGGLFIIGVLVHGIWSTRRNNKRHNPSNYETRKNWEPTFSESDEDIEYDDVVISSARVIDDPSKKTGSSASSNTVDTLSSNTETSSMGEDDKLTNSFTPVSGIESTEDKAESAIANEDESEEGNKDETFKDSEVETKPTSQHFDNSETKDALDSADSQDGQGSDKSEVTQIPEEGETENSVQAPIYSGVVTQPKPEFAKNRVESAIQDDNIPEPPAFLLKKDAVQHASSIADEEGANTDKPLAPKAATPEMPRPEFSLDAEAFEQPTVASLRAKNTEKNEIEKPKKELSLTEQAKRFVRRNKKTVAEKIRKEPVITDKKSADDQMRIDFDSTQAKAEHTQSKQNTDSTRSAASNKGQSTVSSDVLILNVQTPNDKAISGAALLPMLLTLGFKFGEHDIFHRHVNTNGKGPILFSLTNMFKPGVFDIDNMENFSTQGIALFMMLPIDGDAQQVFNMMHNAARKLSEEFGGKILDGNKVPISKQSLQQYAERIREFERRKLTQ